MKRKKTRLAVPRETIRSLGDLGNVRGGIVTGPDTVFQCVTQGASCARTCGLECGG